MRIRGRAAAVIRETDQGILPYRYNFNPSQRILQLKSPQSRKIVENAELAPGLSGKSGMLCQGETNFTVFQEALPLLFAASPAGMISSSGSIDCSICSGVVGGQYAVVGSLR